MFLQNIQSTYGQDVATNMRNTSRMYQKLAKQKNRRIFLLRCKHTNAMPTFLNFNVSHIHFTGTYLREKFNNLINITKQKTINLCITETTKNIIEIDKQINININKLKPILPSNTLNDFLKFENLKYEKTFNLKRRNNENKIKNILCQITDNKTKINTTKWLDNISDTDIPQDITEVLALGENFSLPITNEKQIPITEYIACIESVIQDKPNEIQNSIRADVTNVITNHKLTVRHKKIKTTNFQNNIQKKITKTKQFLKINPQIIVIKSDKSKKTVVMNLSEYENKMNNLLEDTNTYKQLKSDPTTSYQNKNNTIIKKWVNKKIINENEAKKLLIYNSIAPKIYGLPKLHKTGIPLRPIVSSIQSPFYKLSKYLSECISKITGKNDYFVKDSFDFKQFIDSIQIPNNFKLVSLDVTSLYTNIPNDLVSQIIRTKWPELKNHTTLQLNDFIEATNITLNNNYFQYKDTFYQQLDGCAMGSPISSTIAQLVMEYLEETVINNLDINITFFKRYVDDCLTAVPENKITDLINAFNNFHTKLQFTSEIEQNNQINFLDLTLVRKIENEKIKTKWYNKETWSGRYLNFNSNHPKNQKNSVIIGLTDRAIHLTSPEYRPEILKRVKSILIDNHFPEKTISRITKQRIHLFYNSTKKSSSKDPNNKYIAMPYAFGLSEKLKHILSKHNITICHKAHNLIGSLFTVLKSKTPNKKKSNVIYSIPCLNCPKKYIGMTTQLLENRLKGHKYQKNASTALHKHERDTNHEFHFNDTKILAQDNNYKKLIVKEMVQIKKEKDCVNDKKDTSNLSQIYFNLIN